MEIVQTIRLTDKERLIIQNFLKVADEISNIVNCPMASVAEYFIENSRHKVDEWLVDEIHQIQDIEGMG